MPKKNWGVNSKAAEAKARDSAKKAADAERKQKAAEDEYWRDDNKHANRKLDRKHDKQRKHEEEMKRREENRKLLAMENEQLETHKAKQASARPTRAQVEVAREKAERKEKKELGLETKDKAPASEKPIESEASAVPSKRETEKSKNYDSDDNLPALEENVNRILSLNEGDGSARNVDQALVLLGEDEVDHHPERRMKKAHLEFEAAMMQKLKAENPNMRRSQMKELVWREWQRAPENPLNKAAKAASKIDETSD